MWERVRLLSCRHYFRLLISSGSGVTALVTFWPHIDQSVRCMCRSAVCLIRVSDQTNTTPAAVVGSLVRMSLWVHATLLSAAPS